MATTKSLVWKGEAVTERMRAAQIAGIDRVMARCTADAKVNHPWQTRTGFLEGDIQVQEYAVTVPNGARGTWGVRGDSKQARILELGGTIVPVKAKALRFKLPNGQWVMATKVVIRPHPYLRPAGDRQYPLLAKYIRAAYDKSAPATGGGDA